MSTAPPAPGTGTGDGEESSALFAELDALLERMLALPVSYREEPEGPDGAEKPPPRDLPPLVTIAEAMPEPVLTYTTPPQPVAIVDEVLKPRPAFDLAPTNPAAEWAPPPPEKPFVFEEKPAPPLPPPQPPAAADIPAPNESLASSLEPPLPFWQWPLTWVNRCFDRWTVPLGPLGRWLRGPGGRGMLGWAGLMLLAVAGGIALHDWFGWTW